MTTKDGQMNDEFDIEEVEKVAKAIYLSFFLPEWPPRIEVDLGMAADDFRRAAYNVLKVLRGEEPEYEK